MFDHTKLAFQSAMYNATLENIMRAMRLDADPEHDFSQADLLSLIARASGR